MDLSGAVLLDSREPVRRGVPRPRVIGYRKDGSPIYGQRGGTSIWTNMECIYSMPQVGPTKSTTTLQVVSAAAAAEFALASLWPMDKMLGKSLRWRSGGNYDATAVTNTMQLYADTTVTSQSSGVLVAASGAIAPTSSTTGNWKMEVDATCVTVGANTSGWVCDGWIEYAIAAASTTALVRYVVGGTNTLGVPTPVTLVPTTPYFWELWSTWATAPTAFVASHFKMFAEN